MKRVGMIMVVVGLLSGCGEAQGPRTAEAVHTAWITALASGEQTAAQQLVAADAAGPVAFVSRALDIVRAWTHDETRPPAGDDRLQYGVSLWQSADGDECLRTTVQIIDGQWRVVEFGGLLPTNPLCARTP